MQYCNIKFKKEMLPTMYREAAEIRELPTVLQVRVIPDEAMDINKFPESEHEKWLLQVLVADDEAAKIVGAQLNTRYGV